MEITVETINKLVSEKHNIDLVKPTESPNGNIIYHLYSDGEITYQKGGFAYLQRSVFTHKPCINFDVKFKFVFPLERDNFTYAVMTKDDCDQIREMMLDLQKK